MTEVQRISILGHHISLVRPSRPKNPIIFKSDLPKARYLSRTRTIKENCGQPTHLAIELINGQVFTSPVPGTHNDTCSIHDISPHYVKRTGWLLGNGKYLWR